MKEKNQNELELVKGFSFKDVLKVCGPIWEHFTSASDNLGCLIEWGIFSLG